jgi:hypothetical protein
MAKEFVVWKTAKLLFPTEDIPVIQSLIPESLFGGG